MNPARRVPEQLTKEDQLALREVRRDIWIRALYGLGMGTVSGYLLHSGVSFARNQRLFGLSMEGVTPTMNRNSRFLLVMLGGSLGSFLFATAQGKNTVHQLHPIFSKGRKNREEQVSPDGMQGGASSMHENLREETQRNRLLRRESLQRNLRQGQGLNDSHGGHWLPDKR